MKGFNSRNESIYVPNVEIMPPVLHRVHSDGTPYFTITGKLCNTAEALLLSTTWLPYISVRNDVLLNPIDI